MNRKLKAVLILAVVMSLMGCATKRTFTNTTYATLETAVLTYDTSMRVVAQLYADGYLGDADKLKAISVGNKYRATVTAATKLMAEYMESKTKTEEGYNKVEVAIIAAIEAGKELLTLVDQFQRRKPVELPK
jgi:hypothetical protein